MVIIINNNIIIILYAYALDVKHNIVIIICLRYSTNTAYNDACEMISITITFK